jgi:hypothetical protein
MFQEQNPPATAFREPSAKSEFGASWVRDGILILIGCGPRSNKLPWNAVFIAANECHLLDALASLTAWHEFAA